MRRSPQLSDNQVQEAMYLRRAGKTQEEIGQSLLVSKERARQLIATGMKREELSRKSGISFNDKALDIRIFDDFVRGDGYRALRARYGLSSVHLREIIYQEALLHGLPCPSITDGHPIYRPSICEDLGFGSSWQFGTRLKNYNK